MPSEQGSIWRRFFVVCGLTAAAFTAPLLDIFGKNPDVFVANRTSSGEIALFAVVLTSGIPATALALMWLADRIGERVSRLVYPGMVLLLGLATGLVVSRQVFPDSTIGAVVLALALGGVALLLQRRFESVLSWFALALPAVLLLFLIGSPSARLIWGGEEPSIVSGAVANPAPVVLIQLDEMPTASLMTPDGGINSSLFPNFARLAAEGTWYRNALSSSIATTQSVPAILSGTKGEKGMSPSSVDYPNNLFTLLDGSYEMHVIEWVADLCPEDICPDYAGRAPARLTALLADVAVVYGHLTLPPILREDLPSIDNAWKGFLGQNDNPGGSDVAIEGLPVPHDGTRAPWVNWLQRIINGVGDGPGPVLSYAHLQAPHVPWQTNPSGTHYSRPEQYTEVEGVGGDGRWGDDEDAAILGFQRHLYQVGFLDTMLGRLFERLEETGSWDASMIIVLADHGASFVPGEHRRWPYEANRDDLYRVPMFVKYPHQTEGEVRDEPAFGIDVLPTIADVLGVEVDWEVDGISLLDLDGTDRPHEPIWWCCSPDGADTDLEVLFAQVARNHRWVPDQGSWLGVAAGGEYGQYVGQAEARLSVEESEQVRWSLDLGHSLEDADVDSGVVQTLITGRVEFPSGLDPDEFLIVLNGTVAGSGYVLKDSETTGAIRGLVAEELVIDGRNDIEILLPYGNAWLSGSEDVIQLELVTDDGRVLDLVSEGNRRVQVDGVTATEAGWLVEGWAADVVAKQPPDALYVYAADQLLAFGPPNEDNPNVVRWFGSDALLRSGFAFQIDGSAIPDGIDQLTVVAEFGDKAVGDPALISR